MLHYHRLDRGDVRRSMHTGKQQDWTEHHVPYACSPHACSPCNPCMLSMPVPQVCFPLSPCMLSMLPRMPPMHPMHAPHVPHACPPFIPCRLPFCNGSRVPQLLTNVTCDNDPSSCMDRCMRRARNTVWMDSCHDTNDRYVQIQIRTTVDRYMCCVGGSEERRCI